MRQSQGDDSTHHVGAPGVWTSSYAPVGPKQQLWTTCRCATEYDWTLTTRRWLLGTPSQGDEQDAYIVLHGDDNGVTWQVHGWEGSGQIKTDVVKLKTHAATRGLAPIRNRSVARLPHPVAAGATPKTWLRTVPQQQHHRSNPTRVTAIGSVPAQFQRRRIEHRWAEQLLDRAQRQLWAHHGLLTPFQRWFAYRDGTAQLNLFHPGRIDTEICQMTPNCAASKETIGHILWSCPRARETWTWIMSQWLGIHFDDWD